MSKNQKLTQKEMDSLLLEYVIIKELKGKNIHKLKADKASDKLGFKIKQDALDSYCSDVSRWIGISDSFQTGGEVAITSGKSKIKFKDLSKYLDMTLEEVREYVSVWDEVNEKEIKTDKYIEDKELRIRVALVALAKGGTTIFANKEGDKAIEELEALEALTDEQKVRLKALI